MPRYFFNRVNGGRDPDPEGLDLPNIEHARLEAIAFAADTLKDDAFALWDGGEVRIEVVDGGQVPVFTIVISVINNAAAKSIAADMRRCVCV